MVAAMFADMGERNESEGGIEGEGEGMVGSQSGSRNRSGGGQGWEDDDEYDYLPASAATTTTDSSSSSVIAGSSGVVMRSPEEIARKLNSLQDRQFRTPTAAVSDADKGKGTTTRSYR